MLAHFASLGRPSVFLPDFRASSFGFRDTNGVDVDRTTYRERSCLADVVIETDATQLQVELYTSIRSYYAGFAHLSVEAAGDWTIADSTVDNAVNTALVTVPGSGLRQVRISDQITSLILGTVRGTWLRRVTAVDGSVLRVVPPPTVTARWVAYGDSIAAGQGDIGVSAGREGWLPRVRQGEPGLSVAIEAYGGRCLHDDYVGGAFTALIARLVSLAADCTDPAQVTIYIAIGTNDFGLAKWSNVADFQTAYQTLLTAIRAALPSARIVCQTPIARTDVGSNGFGQTIAQYRTAVTAALAASGISNATSLDGTTLVASGELNADGVHPASRHNPIYARRVLDALRPAGTRHTASGFSASNYLQSAPAAGLLDLAANRTIVIGWYQTALSGNNDTMLSYANANTRGWMLTFSNTGQLYVLTRAAIGDAVLVGTPGAAVGWHCLAITVLSNGTQIRHSLDGAAPAGPGSIATYVPGTSATRLEIGGSASNSLFAPNSEVGFLAQLPFGAQDRDLTFLSTWPLSRGNIPLTEAARVLWIAGVDYDPLAGSTVTRGTNPVTLAEIGTVARTAR